MKKRNTIPKGWRKLKVGERCNRNTYWYDYDNTDLTQAFSAGCARSIVEPGHRVIGYVKGTTFITRKTPPVK